MEEQENTAMTLPEWQQRLIDERSDLLCKVIALTERMNDEEFKLNQIEWDMLRAQYYSMKDYLQALTSRCVYYKLIPAADLGISYDKPILH